jgi:transposase
LFEYLGFRKVPGDRTFYRDLERVGLYHKFIFNRYQQLLKKYGLVSEEQFVDFSSSYFEGGKSELGELGYSRDGKPGKKQIVFGISTGMNNVPTALTVQKGNVQDKKHFRLMLKIVKKVLPEDSALIFDCGGNTKENKVKVRKLGFNYLILKSKKKGTYKTYISKFKQEKKEKLVVNNISYKCVKFVEENEIKYMFYSEKLAKEQTKKRKKKFSKELEKNEVKLRKTKKGKALAKYISKEGLILAKGELQKLLSLENPYITGLEGYFILESSIDTSPEKILKLYKEKDKAEKLIRNMKEGTELRPMRHCTELAIIGYLTIIFLTNCLTNLTLFLSKKPDVKNVKLLKKYLNNLTLTIVYPKNRFRFTIISNISQEIRSIFGNYIDKYEDKSLELRW